MNLLQMVCQLIQNFQIFNVSLKTETKKEQKWRQFIDRFQSVFCISRKNPGSFKNLTNNKIKVTATGLEPRTT